MNLSGFLFQTVKCGDYFQAEDGPREFGNISVTTKWIKSTETSLMLRNLEVNYKEVKILYQFASVYFLPDQVLFLRVLHNSLYDNCVSDRGSAHVRFAYSVSRVA